MKTDILCFGAHSDDVELGMGGTIAKLTSENKTVMICDLTEAELSSNGTPAGRLVEAKHAADVLGVKERLNLNMGDRNLFVTQENIAKVVSIIRAYKPEIVFIPYAKDRHPDHGNCSRIVEEAVFSAGIRNFIDPEGLDAHKPKHTYYYMINSFYRPDFCINITTHFEKKINSLTCYQSQFIKQDDGVITPLTEGYLEAVEGRERAFGREVGVLFAEGFKTRKPVLLEHDLLGDQS